MTGQWTSEAEIHRLRSELNRLLEQLLETPAEQGSEWQPAVDLRLTTHSVEVEIEVPGVDVSDIVVELCGSVLRLQGVKRRQPSEPAGVRYHLMERFIGPFSTVVEIPKPVTPHNARATLCRGLLHISLPRITDRRSSSIRIAVHSEETR
jgi:HSP20 family protein